MTTKGPNSARFEDFDLAALPHPRRHQLLLGAVAPRPIAFVATCDAQGVANLAPFSFFNAFSTNPPVVVVSPALSGRDGSTKDTLRNALATRELTISVVDHALAEQASLASGTYPPGVDEFVKSGLTKLASLAVKPPGVAESPCVLECRVRQHVSLGDGKAAGQLLVCDVVRLRVRPGVLAADGTIDPRRIDQVARLGGEWYSRARDGLFEVPKPVGQGVGFDALPAAVRGSSVLTGSDLARLASVETVPAREATWAARYHSVGGPQLHALCKTAVADGRIADAWQLAHLIAESEKE